jgi:hypothetical protein
MNVQIKFNIAFNDYKSNYLNIITKKIKT